MARRHLRTYRRPTPVDEAIVDLERAPERGQHGEPQPTDYRPMVVVIGLVIFGLGLIAFLLTLHSK
jgi:hypothetical protein